MRLPAFKRVEVADIFTPEKIAVFERPHGHNDIVVINCGGKDFHLAAGTLKTIGDVMVDQPQNPA